MLLYYVLSRRIGGKEEEEDDRNGNLSKSLSRSGRRIARRPAQAPATWFEAITTLSETLRFTYSETLGKWPIGDLAFGINYLMRRQVNSVEWLWFGFAFRFCLSATVLVLAYVMCKMYIFSSLFISLTVKSHGLHNH